MGKTKRGDGALSMKEERFIAEYCVDYNGAGAARRAGYKPESAAKIACRLLKREEVMAKVRQFQAEQAKRLCLSSDMVLTKTMETLQRCLVNVPVTEWNPETKQREETGLYVFDSRGAAKCLELLGKHFGTFDAPMGAGTDDRPVILSGEEEIPE